MGLIARILGREQRNAPAETVLTPAAIRESPVRDTSWLGAAGVLSPAGIAVSPEAAQAQVGVLAACVSLISSALAGTAIEVLQRRADGSLEPADEPGLVYLLNAEPNPTQTAFEAREALLRDLLLSGDGNAYAGLDRDAAGRVTALRPYPAGWVTVEQLASGRLRYRVSPPTGGGFILLPEEMLHVRGPSRDGVLGRSPVSLAHGAVALVIAQAGLARTQADRAFLPLLSFQTDGELTQEQYNRLRDGLTEMVNGMGQRNVPLVAESGLKAERLSATSQEADFLNARKLGLQDVARLYNVPPSILGLAERAPFATAEAEARAFVNNALRPWAQRIEQALARSLFTPERRRRMVIRHNLDELGRGDMKARFDAWAVGITNGMFCPDEARDEEGWGPRPDGKGGEFIRPLNMAPAGATQGAAP